MIETITADRLNLIYLGSLILVLWLGWIKAVRPKVRRFGKRISAVLDTFGGREEIEDEVTGERLPAVLPLHRRLTRMEHRQTEQSTTLEQQGTTLERLGKVLENQTEIFRITTDHEVRIGSLEDVEAERSLAREESAAMWRSVADRDVIDVIEDKGELE